MQEGHEPFSLGRRFRLLGIIRVLSAFKYFGRRPRQCMHRVITYANMHTFTITASSRIDVDQLWTVDAYSYAGTQKILHISKRLLRRIAQNFQILGLPQVYPTWVTRINRDYKPLSGKYFVHAPQPHTMTRTLRDFLSFSCPQPNIDDHPPSASTTKSQNFHHLDIQRVTHWHSFSPG